MLQEDIHQIFQHRHRERTYSSSSITVQYIILSLTAYMNKCIKYNTHTLSCWSLSWLHHACSRDVIDGRPKKRVHRDGLWGKARSKIWLAKNCINSIKKVTMRPPRGLLTFFIVFWGVNDWCLIYSIRILVIFQKNKFDHWQKKRVARFLARQSHTCVQLAGSFFLFSHNLTVWRKCPSSDLIKNLWIR